MSEPRFGMRELVVLMSKDFQSHQFFWLLPLDEGRCPTLWDGGVDAQTS